ncbi:MAG: hypothetical protein ACT4OS_08450 [Acidimicrobiales bacterium]
MSAPPLGAYIRAQLRMKPTDDGGRSRPIASGYRPNCWLGGFTADGERAYYDAVVYLESADALEPGLSALIRLQPAFPDLWNDVTRGSVIDVCEGSRIVGEATVVELFRHYESSPR